MSWSCSLTLGNIRVAMESNMFNTTGLDKIDMRRSGDWRGAWYVLRSDHSKCVAKTCSSCREILPIVAFDISNDRRFKLSSRCSECHLTEGKRRDSAPASTGNGTAREERDRRYRERNHARTDAEVIADRRRKRPSGNKRCGTCRVNRPLSEYCSNRGLGDGLSQVCRTCQSVKDANRYTRSFIAYWEANGIPLRCYLCDGPYEHIEHLIPTSLPHGDPGPINTRPACHDCNRGTGGKWDKPLEEYIFSVNHPTKSRGQILHEIVMSGTWPFALTTPEEFIAQSGS